MDGRALVAWASAVRRADAPARRPGGTPLPGRRRRDGGPHRQAGAVIPPESGGHQRSRGALHVTFGRRGEATALEDLRQEGCLKARFPRPVARIEAVTLNTAGGIAGGDRLRSAIVLRPGARATIAGQAAERCYRALQDDPPALVRTTVALGAESALEWLPQETILFESCALDRQLRVDMAGSACFLGVEALVFGRAAMGEQVEHARLADLIRIERDGVPILHDAIRLQGAVGATLRRPAVAGGSRAVATIVFVSPDAAGRLDAVRLALSGCDAEAGASAWDGMLVARLLARNERCLRAAIVAGSQPLRDGRPWPRVWQC